MHPSLLVALILAACAGRAHTAPPPTCPDGLLAVKASLVRLDPPTLRVERRTGAGQRLPLKRDDLLCSGDTLIFVDGQPGTSARLQLDGEQRTVACCADFAVAGGISRLDARALAYLQGLTGIARSLATPERRSRPTQARVPGGTVLGGGSSIGGIVGAAVGGVRDRTEALDLIAPLRDLPRQYVVTDVPVIVGWHGGRGPYRCDWLDDEGDARGRIEVAEAPYCELPAAAARTLRVGDASGQSRYLRAAPASWPEVPRPDWIAPGAPPANAAERAAWAAWLWREGGPAWRAQAVAMLNAERGEWIAGWLLEGILAETPPVAAQ